MLQLRSERDLFESGSVLWGNRLSAGLKRRAVWFLFLHNHIVSANSSYVAGQLYEKVGTVKLCRI